MNGKMRKFQKKKLINPKRENSLMESYENKNDSEKESPDLIHDSSFKPETSKIEKKQKKIEKNTDSPEKSPIKDLNEIREDEEVSENEAEYRKYVEEGIRKEEEIKKRENLHEFDEASMPSERKPQNIRQKDEIDDLMESLENKNQGEKESPVFNTDSVFKPKIQKNEEDSPDKIEKFWDGMA